MAKREDVHAFLARVEEVFMERHTKYGSKGMTLEKASAMAATKLDRINAGGEMEDSATDLAGYAVIIGLLNAGLWHDADYVPGATEIVEQLKAAAAREDERDNTLLIKRELTALEFPLPSPKKAGDVGFDLHCVEDTVLPARSATPVNIPSGIAVKLPRGHWADIRSRSSTGRRGIEVVACVIDEGYTGPLYACCYNRTDADIVVPRGERLAQFVLHKSAVPPVLEVDTLPETERGATGFGSTGS